MSTEQPIVVILGGINGAGKTTASAALIGERLELTTFVNADAIARGLNAFAPESASFEAGRVMLAQLQELAQNRSDFAFETTLAGRSYLRFIQQLRTLGYRVEIYYFWLPYVEAAIARVRMRVLSGGHDIPEQTIRQRFQKSLSNFWHHYRLLADHWAVYSNFEGPALTAHGSGSSEPIIADPLQFTRFMELLIDAS